MQDKTGGTYFSIKDFAFDQWDTYHNQPYGIDKITFMNGKADTLHTNVEQIDWAAVFNIFLDTDISDPKYLDKYSFSQFSDEATGTKNYYYEAKDAKLFTRKLHIMANARNDKISSVYIETAKNTSFGQRTQRLFYIPVKSIVIQEFEASATGGKKDVRVEYRFL